MKVILSRAEYERIELCRLAIVEFDFFHGELKPLQTLYVCEPFKISKGGRIYYAYDYPTSNIPAGFFKPADKMTIKMCRLHLLVREVIGLRTAFVEVTWNRYGYMYKYVDSKMARMN